MAPTHRLRIADGLLIRAVHAGDVGIDHEPADDGQPCAAQQAQHGHEHERNPLAAVHGGLDVQRMRRNARKLAEPLRPEQKRCSRAEAQDDDERDVAGVGERDERAPLRNKHAERRHEHDHDAGHHEAGQARHALEQQVHVLDVAAADVMLGRAHAQKQQAFRHGMEQHQERRRPDGLGRANAGAGHDQAQVGDGGVRQHALGVSSGRWP